LLRELISQIYFPIASTIDIDDQSANKITYTHSQKISFFNSFYSILSTFCNPFFGSADWLIRFSSRFFIRPLYEFFARCDK
jgi:hypothetical protein